MTNICFKVRFFFKWLPFLLEVNGFIFVSEIGLMEHKYAFAFVQLLNIQLAYVIDAFPKEDNTPLGPVLTLWGPNKIVDILPRTY